MVEINGILGPVSKIDPAKFLDILDDALSEAELSRLCRRFGVSFDAFPGVTKREKIRGFLGYFQRQGRLTGLADSAVHLRPDLAGPISQLFEHHEVDLSWLDQVAAGVGDPMDTPMTWQWTASTGSGKSIADASQRSSRPDNSRSSVELDPPLPLVPANPFTPGRRVSDESMFFGRAMELERLLSYVADGKHVAIISGRGVGGSSLLFMASRQEHAPGRRLAAYIDLRDPACHTLPGLLNRIWSQWWAQVKPDNPAPVKSLSEFLTAVGKLNSAGFKPVMFLDELEQLAWRPEVFNDEFFNAWLELGRVGNVNIVTTAHATPADLLAQGGLASRFHGLFQHLELGLMDQVDARSLLEVPMQRAGMAIPDGAVEYLLARAGPHPFFLQIVGFYFYDFLAQEKFSRGEVARCFETAALPYWQEMWDSLSPLAQSHFPGTRVSAARGVPARQLQILANKGLVIADGGGYRPFSDGFANWVERQQAASAAASTAVSGPEITF